MTSSSIRNSLSVPTGKMPDVSVIIVNYNTFALTSQCIRSVIDKTSGISYEIILVDNASPEAPADDFKKLFPSIILVKNPVNEGFAGGNNRGLEHAAGEYILLLNSDTILKNNAISISFERMKQSPSIGALSCKLLYADERVQPLAGRFPDVRRELKDLLRLTRNLNQQQRADLYLGTEFDYQSEREVDWIWGTFFMFPRKVLAVFDGRRLPSDFFMYMEDMLWCFQLRKAGYQIVYSPAGEVYHLIAGSSADKNTDAFERYSKKILPNEYKFICKTKGLHYARFYYFVKALNHLSLRTKADLIKSKTYFSRAVH